MLKPVTVTKVIQTNKLFILPDDTELDDDICIDEKLNYGIDRVEVIASPSSNGGECPNIPTENPTKTYARRRLNTHPRMSSTTSTLLSSESLSKVTSV